MQEEYKQHLEQIIDTGRAMREAQKEYFRLPGHKQLMASKQLEKKFDELLARQIQTERQGSLI